MTVDANSASLLRPIVGIENRTAQEVFDIMCDRFRLAALPASDHAGLVDVAKAFHDGPLMADDHEFVPDSEQGKWCIEVAQFFATALSAQASPAPLEGVTDELVERASKDGLAYGSNVEGADPETAWMQSRVRASLTKDQSNG